MGGEGSHLGNVCDRCCAIACIYLQYEEQSAEQVNHSSPPQVNHLSPPQVAVVTSSVSPDSTWIPPPGEHPLTSHSAYLITHTHTHNCFSSIMNSGPIQTHMHAHTHQLARRLVLAPCPTELCIHITAFPKTVIWLKSTPDPIVYH